MDYNIGSTVILKGKTSHGKNRIIEQGDKWVIEEERDKVGFSSIKGNWLKLKSIDIESEIRWVHLTGDKNFIVIKDDNK